MSTKGGTDHHSREREARATLFAVGEPMKKSTEICYEVKISMKIERTLVKRKLSQTNPIFYAPI